MPRDASLELRMMIQTHEQAASAELAQAGLSFSVDSDVANWQGMLSRLDPQFLDEVERTDQNDQLSIAGKRVAWLKDGEAAVKTVAAFREKHESVLEKRAQGLQQQIEVAAAKRFGVANDPAQVATLAARLKDFSREEVTGLYERAEPRVQIAIEAVAALTGGKVPEKRGPVVVWADMIPEEVCLREAGRRNALADPNATAEKSYVLLIKGSYRSIANSAAKLVELQLAKRGVLPPVTRFIDPLTGSPLQVPADIARRSASGTSMTEQLEAMYARKQASRS